MTDPSRPTEAYQPDRTLRGKIRRRVVRLAHRRPLLADPPGPMVSFCFDDAPLSAAREGAAVLERNGARGVYYVAAGLSGTQAPMGVCARAADYHGLAERGHEIGCHTYSHLDCGQATGEAAEADCARNAATLLAWSLPAPVSFAYPYGDVNAAAKAALAPRFGLLRALHPGLVVRGSDLNQAPAVAVEGRTGEADGLRWIEAASQRRGWLILFTHDVDDHPSPWGCTPKTLERLVRRSQELGLAIVTVAEGLERLGLRPAP